MSLVSYCSISAALLAVTISSAFYTSSLSQITQQTNTEIFIRILVHMLDSKVYVLSCMNAGLCSLILFGKLTQWFFFGNLRISETKVCIDRVTCVVVSDTWILVEFVWSFVKLYFIQNNICGCDIGAIGYSTVLDLYCLVCCVGISQNLCTFNAR